MARVPPVHLLIDFENVRDVRLTSVPADCHVAIFVGRLQKSISLELTMDAQRLGARLEWIKVEGDGRNNLDFHVAFYLGRFSVQHRDAELVVLSKDKGFDALLKHTAAKALQYAELTSGQVTPI